MTPQSASRSSRLSPPEADALAVEHIPLVTHVVRETMARVPAHVDRDDLRSAGLAALVSAARAFDPERGIPFARYAVTRIRGALVDELRSVDWASRSVRRRSKEIEDARTRLAASMGRLPDNGAVASALGVDQAEIDRSDEDVARATVLSLHAGPDNPYADVLPSREPGPELVIEHRERLEYVEHAVEELPERLRVVIRGYFLEERPMAEIAEELGVSESRVSQMRAEALVLMRDAVNSALDPDLVVPHKKPDGCVSRRRDAYFAAVAERHSARRVVASAATFALDTTA